MSMAHASAVRTSAVPKAAPPVTRASAPQARYAAPPLASLAAIPAGPAVQRKCDACESEEKETPGLQRRLNAAAAAGSVQRQCAACEQEQEETGIQPRLEVGPVGDRYEVEADSIAAQVMAMRDPGVAEASHAGGAVQRACSACSSSREEPRTRRFADPGEDEREPLVRARRDGGSETIAASDAQLTSGGSELPRATRSFFERRMGRDLGGVRVHRGSDAAARNDSISARAFTYKNHVWLGSGESAAPSFTMAHELAHVMQQTSPGPVGPAPRRVQRIKCDPLDDSLFFAPTDTKQKDAEQAFIAKLTTKTGLLGEVPIPNATRGSNGCKAAGQSGRADLVQTNNGNFVGFQFGIKAGEQNPRPWYVPETAAMGCTGMEKKRFVPQSLKVLQDMFIDGAATPVAKSGKMAPKTDYGTNGLQFSTDAGSAPSSISIGEVKFGGTRSARKGARGQIDNYRAGFQFARTGYENIRQNIDKGSNELEGGTKPTLAAWPAMTTDYLTTIKGVSDDWQAQGDSKDLVTAKFIEVGDTLVPKRCENIAPQKGKLYHGHDSEFKFVWLYVWYPDAAPPGNAAGGSAKFTNYRETASRLLSQATTAPGGQPKVRKRPRVARVSPAIVARKAKPAKPIPAEDPFKAAFPKWKEERKTLAKEFKGFEKTDEFGKDTMRIQFNQALKNTTDITGKSPNAVVPDKSEKMVEAEKGLRNLEIMAGPAGGLIGELRFRLGGVFLKILSAYEKVKTKIEGLFKKKAPGSSGGNLATRAFKVFTTIIGAVASYLLPRVTDALIDCVENGFRTTIEKWIDESPLGTIEEAIKGYMEKAEALKEEIFGEVEAFVERLLGPVQAEYEAVKKVVEGIVRIVDIAKKAFDVARALACLAGGLETAGLSCVVAAVDKLLGLVGLSPSEHLMAWLLESCPAKEYFAKAMLAYKEIKKIPQAIAKKIVELVRPALPDWLQSFVCDPKTMDGIDAELPSWDEVACDGSENGLTRSGRPSDVEADVDRIPTAAEAKNFGGFDIGKVAGERPKLPPKPKPQDPVPPPADEKKPPVIVIPDLVPPAVGKQPGGAEGGKTDGDSAPPKINLVTKPISGLDPKGTSIGVFFLVHPTPAQGGWKPGDYNLTTSNRLTLISKDKNYGPTDPVSITIHKIYPADPPNSGKHKIDFTLNQGIRVTDTVSGSWLEAAAGLRNEYTQVGAAK